MNRSLFKDVPLGQADPILGLTEDFKKDTHPSKVNLGVGIYLDENGKFQTPDAVKKASAIWLEREDSKAYLAIDGVAAFNQLTQELVFGKNAPVLSQKKVATIQSIGGSGALRLATEFIKTLAPDTTMYVSDPSWENHRVIFGAVGLKIATYPYYDPATSGLRRTEMLEALRSLPPRSAVLLHGCCHNPTGVDIDRQSWEEIATICAERELIPLLDCAYQGFADGLDADAFAPRLFAERGLTFLVCTSFAKSLSLYRERVGALSLVTGSATEATNVLSQVKRIIRSQYSSPPSYGAQIAAVVLGTPELRASWEKELDSMRTRILDMRQAFTQRLAEVIPHRDFSFILKQRGMFSYSGLSIEVIRELRSNYHIYALDSGRICVAAMNQQNVQYVCDAIAAILKKHP